MPTSLKYSLYGVKNLTKLKDFLFTQSPRYLIELIRIVFYTYLFIYYSDPNEVTGYLKLHSIYWNPGGFFYLFDFLKPPLLVPPFVHDVWKLSLFCCAAGLFSKYFKWVSLVLSIIYYGYFSNFYLYAANYIIITYCLMVFTFVDFGKRWSLDNLLLNRKVNLNEPVESWPLNFIKFIFVGCWFFSAIQKLRFSGLEWITINHMQSYIRGTSVGYLPALLLQVGSVLTLFLELISPLVLKKRFKWPLLLALFCFHIVSIKIFEIPLVPWLLCFIFWVTQGDIEFLKLKLAKLNLRLPKLMPYNK